MFEFIENLHVADEDKRKLRSLGATSPAALLALIVAADKAIYTFLGPETTVNVKNELAAELNDDEKLVLESPMPTFKTGAIISDKPAKVRPVTYDIQKRDELFAHLQQLRSQKSRSGGLESPEIESEITHLEQQLNSMMEL